MIVWVCLVMMVLFLNSMLVWLGLLMVMGFICLFIGSDLLVRKDLLILRFLVISRCVFVGIIFGVVRLMILLICSDFVDIVVVWVVCWVVFS